MPFNVTVSNTTFWGRKGRKLIAPLQITVAALAPSDLNGCRLQISVVAGTSGGPFLIEPVPGSWDGNVLNKITVISSTPFAAGLSATVKAFASFFSVVNLGTTQDFDQDYQIDVIDSGGATVPGSTVKIRVTADPAINKSVVFLLDHTSNMGNSYGGVTRLQRLQTAMTRALAFFRATDGIGVVTLDHVTSTNLQGATVRVPLVGGTVADATAVCSTLTLDTTFPNRVYQGSIDAARSQSATATVLIVTDGVGLRSTPPTRVQDTPTSALFIEAVLPSGTLNPPSPTTILNMCSALPGASALSQPGTGEFAMEKLLSQILIDLGGGATVSDPDGSLGPRDEPLSFPLSLNETDRELELIVFSDHADLLDVRLEGPGLKDGQQQEEDCHKGHEAAERVVKFKRITLPATKSESPDPKSQYRAVISHSKNRALPNEGPVSFTFLAAVQSDLLLDASVSATGLEVGAELLFSVTLTEYGFPVRDREGLTVRVELRHPDGGIETLNLCDESGSGRFEGSRRTFRPGVYGAHFVVKGTTWLQCRPFRREMLRTIRIFEPGTSDSRCPPRVCC